MRVIYYNLSHVVAQLHTTSNPNRAKERPGPNQHDGDGGECKEVLNARSRTRRVSYFFSILTFRRKQNQHGARCERNMADQGDVRPEELTDHLAD